MLQFLDIENDGLLDLYVINYIDEANSIMNDSGEVVGFDHDCADNLLFHNTGSISI